MNGSVVIGMSNEKELRERFLQDLEVARKFTEPLHQLMDKYYEMYRNRWSDNECHFQISDLYTYVETVVPILTNNRVRASVHAEYPDYVRHAEGMGDILDHTFDVNDWDYNAQEIARMAEIYRSAIAYTGYDAEAKNGTGQLCVKPINIRYCYFDPSPTEFEESSYFFYVEPMRASKIKKLHPDKAKEIKPYGDKKDAMGENEKKSGWFKSFIRSVTNFVSFNTDNTGMHRITDFQTLPEMDEEEKRKNSVAYIHYWYRDDEDKWRCSYWANDVFLEDKANIFHHGELPYDIYNPTKDPLSALGIPMGEHIEKLNYEKNVLMTQIIRSAKRTVDPPLLYNTQFKVDDPQKIREQANGSGVVMLNNPDMVPLSSIADFANPAQLPGWVHQMPDLYGSMEDRITGVNDSFRGMSEASSGKEVQLKQEAAYTRIKTKVDNFERFVKSISYKTIINAMQFYDETRGFRIKGDYRKYQDIDEDETPFEVKPIPRGVDPNTGEETYDKNEFFMYANPNEWTKIVDDEENDVPVIENFYDEGKSDRSNEDGEEENKEKVKEAFRILQMVVEIEAGSSLPTSRMARREEALELFGASAIDQQALLEAYDYPKADEIIKRMQEKEMQQMEAQAQASAPPVDPMAQIPMEPPMEPQQPDLASQLDALRQQNPELAQLSDEELVQILGQMQVA
jgi:hypothetical protein